MVRPVVDRLPLTVQRYLLHRLWQSVVTLLLASIVVFAGV
jgi:hypothetical protein